jgi:spore coat protein U-like protein
MKLNLYLTIPFMIVLWALGPMFSTPAMAQAVQTITAQATVTDACAFGAAAGTLDFGSLAAGATPVEEVSSINVDCNPTAPWTVSAAVGAGAGETVTNRLLAGTGGNTATVSWELFQDGTCTAAWGDTAGAGGDLMAGVGTGAVQNMPICGEITGGVVPDVPADVYSEIVTITLNFT